MLPKPNRLRLEKDIKALFTKGKGVFNTVCGMKLRPNRLPVSRFAVVVGTKVSKKAVERNRLRRKIRALLEERLEEMKPGYDVAMIVRPKAMEVSKEELEKEIIKVLKKSPLL